MLSQILSHNQPTAQLTMGLPVLSYPKTHPSIKFSFWNNNSRVRSPSSARFLYKDIFAAQTFNSLLLLNRWTDISSFHFNELIDWDFTWSNLHFHNSTLTSSGTNFSQSNLFAFGVKLILDELPWLSVLQKRKPDVYDPEWKCFLCKHSNEDFSHIWQCSAIHLLITHFHQDALKIFISNFEAVYEGCLPASFVTKWNSLDSLSLPSSTYTGQGFTFDYLIKGLVPKDMVECVSSIFPKKIAQESLLISLCTIKTLFFKKVWLLRCHEFANVEQSLNITSHQKRTTSRSIGSNPNNLITSTPTPSLLNRWKVWIARAIGSGSPWMGFPLYINGIIG